MKTSSSKRQAFQQIFQRRPFGKLLIVLLAGGLIGSFGVQKWLRSQQFEAAVRAYEAGDCNQAIAGFKSFDGSPEVEKVRQQCRDYQAIDPATQKPSEALLKAMQFLQAHPSNAFSARGLPATTSAARTTGSAVADFGVDFALGADVDYSVD